MRHSGLGTIFSFVIWAAVVAVLLGTAFGQNTQKKPSVWQQMKDAAKRGAQQGQPQQPQQQPVQKPAKPGPARQQALGQVNDSGPFKPPAGTKIQEAVLAPVQEGAKFEVSPHGVHVATLATDGSRAVVWYDGVEGPKFDEILPQNGNYSVAFSPDGNRYAYCARAGNELVVMVDGKELVRRSESVDGHYDGSNCTLGFTANSKHVYYTSWVNLGTERGKSFMRFVFDGKPSPPGSVDKDSIAISPDGDHFAYTLTISDPRSQDRYEFAVDGKVMPYIAGGPQWTSDSKHLYTQRRSPPNGTELLFDGKPIAKAFSFRIYIPQVGDLVVVAVTGGTNFHPFSFLVVNGKKVPGSDTVERGSIDSVVFSPDGKHYAAICGDINSHHYVIVDGKRGQEYVSVDKLAFTPDSSTVLYTAYVNGKSFIVVGDKEFGGAIGSVAPPVVAPVGNRLGAFMLTNGVPDLLVDGKVAPVNARGADNLSFTPDGAHYAYLAVDAGMGRRLVIDGVPQPQSALSNDTIDMQNPGALKYIFSADSKHVAHFAIPTSPTGDYQRGVFLDNKYVEISADGTNTGLTFSPDSKHLFWIHQYGNHPLRLFVDGKPLADFYSAGSSLSSVPHWWDFGGDGTMSFLVQDDNSLKRVTITLSDATSLATMLGDGSAVAANH
ncbi:MAG TPA: hypothetical protein VJS37_06915 [Terriglobales bacterium]|nr:hypothetical protein [Terriglobales bacterium]